MKNLKCLAIIVLLGIGIVLLASGCDLIFGKEYSLSFDANGGTGAMDPLVLKANQVVQLPANTFSKTEHTFSGWATTSAGSVEYVDEADYTMGNSDTTLYAIWAQAFARGDGSAADPYQIETADQLDNVRDYLDMHFLLAANIDMSGFATGTGWEPIGDESDPFTGDFDGDDWMISDLYIDRPTTDQVGLFGTASGAVFTDVLLSFMDVTGHDFVGGLVGQAIGTDIVGVSVEGAVKGNQYIGGLFGLIQWEDPTISTIDRCSSEGTVDGETSYIGGLGGYLSYSTLTECQSSATVTGSEDSVGGLIGSSQSSTIARSFATGTVSGDDSTGGLVGYLSGDSSNSITDCYASGNVTGLAKVGGLLGSKSYDPKVIQCYAVGVISGTSNLGGLIGGIVNSAITVANGYYDEDTTGQNGTDNRGTGKTTVEMQQEATFVNFNFTTIWDIDEGNSYPQLQWENN
jgi:uncharacterized repeat protein (TIGR02543 family)